MDGGRAGRPKGRATAACSIRGGHQGTQRGDSQREHVGSKVTCTRCNVGALRNLISSENWNKQQGSTAECKIFNNPRGPCAMNISKKMPQNCRKKNLCGA